MLSMVISLIAVRLPHTGKNVRELSSRSFSSGHFERYHMLHPPI